MHSRAEILKPAFWLLILSCSFGFIPDARSADCKSCEQKLSEIRQKETQIEENTEFLGKNRAYLTMLSPTEASKFLKVEGNIMMILQRIDELKKDVVRLESEMEKQGCDACPGMSTGSTQPAKQPTEKDEGSSQPKKETKGESSSQPNKETKGEKK